MGCLALDDPFNIGSIVSGIVTIFIGFILELSDLSILIIYLIANPIACMVSVFIMWGGDN